MLIRQTLYLSLGTAVVAGAALALAAAPLSPEKLAALDETHRARVDFYPGALFFLGDTRLLIAGETCTVVWDLGAPGEGQLERVSRAGAVMGVSGDLSLVAFCTPGGSVEVWSSDTLEKESDVCVLENTAYPRAAFSPDGLLLAVTDRWNEIDLWDLAALSLSGTLAGHASNLFGVAFSPDGQVLVSAGGKSNGTPQSSCLKVWDVATRTLLADLPTFDVGDNHATAFAGGGTRFISAGNYRFVVWDTATWARVYEAPRGYPCTYGLSISPDQRLLALALDTRQVRLIDLSTFRTVRDIAGPSEAMSTAFSPDGTRLAASFTDGTVIVWSAP